MQIDIVTIFPNVFDAYFGESIIKRAQLKNLLKINIHDLRKWTFDKHHTVDKPPFGGGAGMVMMISPIYKSVKSITNEELRIKNKGREVKRKIILTSAKGRQYNQQMAVEFSELDQLIIICGHYEGVDQRVADYIADEEISVGPYVLSGGELPAMIITDTIARLIPGSLGNPDSLKEETFNEIKNYDLQITNSVKNLNSKTRSARLRQSDGKSKSLKTYSEYPQYTRPEVFKTDEGSVWKVPEVLLSGNHKEIDNWRKEQAKLNIKLQI